jgi:hypothetical protein
MGDFLFIPEQKKKVHEPVQDHDKGLDPIEQQTQTQMVSDREPKRYCVDEDR